MNNPEDIEKLTTGDFCHKTTKVVLSAIPVAGSAIAELFTTIIGEPVQRRRVEWLNSLYAGLKEIEAKVDRLSIEKLGENEEFVSVLMTAIQIAQRSHQKEKLGALRNAVIDTALEIDIRDDLKFMFLSLIDELTVTQIKMLSVTNDPNSYAKLSGEEFSIEETKDKILNLAFPDLTENDNMYKLFSKTLHTKGLFNVDDWTLNYNSSGQSYKITSDLGESFLRFIMEPDLKNEELRENPGG